LLPEANFGGHGPPYKTNFPETGNQKPETLFSW